jgi:hypothetical protein
MTAEKDGYLRSRKDFSLYVSRYLPQIRSKADSPLGHFFVYRLSLVPFHCSSDFSTRFPRRWDTTLDQCEIGGAGKKQHQRIINLLSAGYAVLHTCDPVPFNRTVLTYLSITPKHFSSSLLSP